MNILGVSAGNGVLLYPFEQSLYHLVLGNIEGRPDYTFKGKPYQWELNFKGPFTSKLEYFIKHYHQKPVDVILGHPKCGNSSKLALSRGKEYRSDKHRTDPSFMLFFEAVNYFKPKYWMLENLPKLMEEFSELEISELVGGDYFIHYLRVNDMDLGGSQESRNRIIVIGYKTAEYVWPILRVNTPEYTQYLLENLPINGHFKENMWDRIAIYGGRQMTIAEIQQYWFKYKPKRIFITLPGDDDKMAHAPGVYINWENTYPKTARKSNRQFNPNGLPMSPRELARIQNIPDSFKILDPILSAKKGLKLSKTALLNKARITVGSTPSFNVGKWFYKSLFMI